MGKTKVLEVFAEPFSNGGQEAFVMNVLQNMDMTNLHIDLLTPYYSDNEYYKGILKKLGCGLYSWGLDFMPGKSRFFYIKLFSTFFKRHKYDVVHIHSGSISALTYIAYAAKKTGVKKIIVHSHSTGNPGIKHSVIKGVAAPLLEKVATDYLACSVSAGEWKFSSKICDNRLSVVKNGIDIQKFRYNSEVRNQTRNELGVPKNTIILGHVGRLSAEKNQSFLIDVLHRLSKKERDYRLLLIGAGEDRAKLEKKVETLGLNDKVIFLGNVNNVCDYMQAMDVFLFPSLFEGLGIVAIEAQGAGLPVIASNNVPEDICITSLAERISLDDMDLWIKKLEDIAFNNRKTDIKSIQESGYDIADTARAIREIYLNDHKSKVLVFGMTPSYGGVESFVMNYYKHMNHDKVQFDFLCNTTEKIAYYDEIKALGSQIYNITPKGDNLLKYKRELKHFFENKANEYDAIWVNVCNLVNLDYLKLAKKYKIKKRIIHSHNSECFERSWRDLVHIIHRTIIDKYATDFWACSYDAAKWFYRGETLKKSNVIYNAIDISSKDFDLEKRNEIRRSIGAEGRYIIGTVGRMTYQKNQSFLISLMSQLTKIDPLLIIVGTGEEEDSLRKQATDLNVQDNVMFVGPQRDIQAWLSSFDVFAFPSHYEGLSVALLEAEANGVPIVATKRAVDELAKINANIFICEGMDEWKSQIMNMYNQDLRVSKEEVAEGFKHTRFDINSEAKKLQDFFLN